MILSLLDYQSRSDFYVWRGRQKWQRVFTQPRPKAAAFVLFGIGGGAYSLDQWRIGAMATRARVNGDSLGLLLRPAVAASFIIGGMFAGYDAR